MKLKKYLTEATGMGGDGLSKAKLGTLIRKKIGKKAQGIFKDDYWKGVKAVFKAFDDLDLNWQTDKVETQTNNKENGRMYDTKVWNFTIFWEDNKGKHKKTHGVVTAHGAGTNDQPMEKYDVSVILGL